MDGPFIDRHPEMGPCWPWHGMTIGGYGKIKDASKNLAVHRVMYELWRGAISPGMTLDHLCHSLSTCPGGECAHRVCCNPLHMEQVTHAENTRRGSRGRKTVCKRGHDLTDPTNLKQNNRGVKQRQCLACVRLMWRAKKYGITEEEAAAYYTR